MAVSWISDCFKPFFLDSWPDQQYAAKPFPCGRNTFYQCHWNDLYCSRAWLYGYDNDHGKTGLIYTAVRYICSCKWSDASGLLDAFFYLPYRTLEMVADRNWYDKRMWIQVDTGNYCYHALYYYYCRIFYLCFASCLASSMIDG